MAKTTKKSTKKSTKKTAETTRSNFANQLMDIATDLYEVGPMDDRLIEKFSDKLIRVKERVISIAVAYDRALSIEDTRTEREEKKHQRAMKKLERREARLAKLQERKAKIEEQLAKLAEE